MLGPDPIEGEDFIAQPPLAVETGHKDLKMIYKDYGELVRPKNAARYWQLKPSPPKEEKVVPIERTREELKEFLRTAQVAKMEPANCGTQHERRQAREKEAHR